MDEKEFEEGLQAVLWGDTESLDDIKQITTFADAGLLTSDKGLVVKMRDGSEFQVTIIRSK